jgi:hypothetical protein
MKNKDAIIQELNDLSPLISLIKNKSEIEKELSANYFEEMQTSIFSKIALEEADPKVESDMPKDEYFYNLQNKVININQNKAKVFSISKYVKWAAAALITIISAFTIYYSLENNQSNKNIDLAIEIENNDDLEFLLHSVNDSELVELIDNNNQINIDEIDMDDDLDIIMDANEINILNQYL